MDEKFEIILNQCSVLLAEDEQRVRESFKKVLLLYADNVYTAGDGEEAYELYKKHNPSIIITDIKMPKINGLELIKKIRQKNKEIPIIVTSAYTDQDFLLESIKLSLIEYVIKPIKEKDLNRLLQECAQKLYEKSEKVIKLTEDSTYDFENKILSIKKQSIPLTQKEIEFFEILLARRGNLVTKQDIEDKLYIYEEAPLSAVKNLVFKLRKKINADIIQTVGKLGYKIE